MNLSFAAFYDNVVVPGKVGAMPELLPGHFPYGGFEVVLNDFEVLTQTGCTMTHVAVTAGAALPPYSVFCGQDGGPNYCVRGVVNGVYVPGKTSCATECTVVSSGYLPYNGTENIVSEYDILTAT